jgi:hypothetical protein
VPEEPDTGPERIVYGEYGGTLVLLSEDLAQAISSEIIELEACGTVGEARRLDSLLMPSSDFEDDDGDPLPDDAPYDLNDSEAVQNGEWPPMPGGYALEDLPEKLLRELMAKAGAKVVDTTLSGSFFAVPLDREADMVNVLRSAGYEVIQDGSLIYSIGRI